MSTCAVPAAAAIEGTVLRGFIEGRWEAVGANRSRGDPGMQWARLHSELMSMEMGFRAGAEVARQASAPRISELIAELDLLRYICARRMHMAWAEEDFR